ncbi:hypothetical protein [Pseudomonas sp.]|uniref:hypothetical protein n=1 Tax=Pseudomonas sp. TaxID=306 RepID=UPI0025D18392|nr:hypothetical protein [Pseudomonas sp.]
MSIPIAPETPDPNIDQPALPPVPEPQPQQEPPECDPQPMGDPPCEQVPRKVKTEKL